MEREIKPGTYVELPDNVGPIPKGIYKLKTCDEISAEFRPGKKSTFVIFGNWRTKVKAVPASLAWRKKKSQKDFVNDYYNLLEENRGHQTIQSLYSDIYTICFLDQSLMKGSLMDVAMNYDC